MAKVTMKMVANAVLASLENRDGAETMNENVTVDDVRAWFTKEIDKAERRNSKAAERNKAKKAEADAPLMKAIVELLNNAEKPMLGREIKASLEEDDIIVSSTNKVAVLARKIDGIKIEKTAKGNAYSL